MAEKLRVIFVSRRNSLRSILAEACLVHLDSRKFTVISCGQPGHVASRIHPAAVGALGSAGIALPASPPKSWERMRQGGAPVADFVITLDAEIASLTPRWPGQPDVAVWPFADIAAAGDDEEMAVAAIRMLYALRRRLELLVSLPLSGADRSAIRSDLRDLAHLR